MIHRDVSTTNVLLEALANNVWKAKLSDFGSANLVQYATTPGEGHLHCSRSLSLAPNLPNSSPTLPNSSPTPTPHSYGVLLGEVITQELPDPGRLQEMVDQKLWSQMHLVTSCIQHSPEKRPIMSNILEDLDKLTTHS